MTKLVSENDTLKRLKTNKAELGGRLGTLENSTLQRLQTMKAGLGWRRYSLWLLSFMAGIYSR